MTIEEKVSFLKKLTINIFLFCFVITTFIASLIIYFFLSNNDTLSSAIKISSVAGLVLSIIVTVIFYLNFRTYDKLEQLVSDLCVDNKGCALKSFIYLIIHFNFPGGIKNMDEDTICRNDFNICDRCTLDDCKNCPHKKGVKK